MKGGFFIESSSLWSIWALNCTCCPTLGYKGAGCICRESVQLVLAWYLCLSSIYPGDKIPFKTPVGQWNRLDWRQPVWIEWSCKWSSLWEVKAITSKLGKFASSGPPFYGHSSFHHHCMAAGSRPACQKDEAAQISLLSAALTWGIPEAPKIPHCLAVHGHDSQLLRRRLSCWKDLVS